MTRSGALIIIVLIVITSNIKAQNLINTQSRWNNALFNPGIFGIRNQSLINVGYQNLNFGNDITFQKYYLCGDVPIVSDQNTNLGGMHFSLIHERSGINKEYAHIMPTIGLSLRVPINKYSDLRFGISTSYSNKHMDLSALTTGSQYITGIGFNPELFNGELMDEYRSNEFMINSGLHYSFRGYSGVDLGAVGVAVNDVSYSFSSNQHDKADVPSIYTMAHVFLANRVNYQMGPELFYYHQQVGTVVFGWFATFDLSHLTGTRQVSPEKLNFFCRYSSEGKMMLGTQIETEEWLIGFSYDQQVVYVPENSLKGGFEILIAIKNPINSIRLKRRSRNKIKRNTAKEKLEAKSFKDTVQSENKNAKDIIKAAEEKEEQYAMDSVFLDTSDTMNIRSGKLKGNIRKKVFTTDVHFDFNSFNLSEEARKVLSEYLDKVKGYQYYQINIVGHSDDIGNNEQNKIISEKRAKVVMNYLFSNGGDYDKIFCEGKGESEPLMPNTSSVNRSINRRVSIEVIVY